MPALPGPARTYLWGPPDSPFMESAGRREGRGGSNVRKESSEEKGKAPRKGRSIARRVSLGALVVSVMALAAALLVPGPQGPAGRETVMASNAYGGVQTIGSACTHYSGAEVTIQVPSAGTVVVSATVGVGINHAAGAADEARIVVATSEAECTLNNYMAFVSVPPTLATDSLHFETVPLLRPFAVAGAGPLTVYVNGIMEFGADPADRFDSASLVATFYPG